MKRKIGSSLLLMRLRSAALAWAAVGALGAVGVAHAGLFDDDEARKAILELRSRIAQNDEATKARLTELSTQIAQLREQNQQLVEQLQALRRSLLELNNHIESVRAESAKLRGSDEQLARELSELQRRQRDVVQGIDERMRRLEPIKVSLDGEEFLADPQEKQQFDDALGLLKGGEFDKAAQALGQFLRRFPASGYADSSRLWLANALYGKRDYKEAIAAYRAFVAAAPKHPKAPDALLAAANSQLESKDRAGARRTLDELVKTYPQSETAKAARERLAALK